MSRRSQKRSLARGKLKPQEVDAILKQEQLEGIQRAVEAMFIVVAYELHRRNWKKKTIQSFLKRMDYTFDSVLKEYIDLEEIRQILKDELDLDI